MGIMETSCNMDTNPLPHKLLLGFMAHSIIA